MRIIIDNIEQFQVFFDVIHDVASDLLELQLFPDRLVCCILSRGNTRFFNAEYSKDFFEVYSVDDVDSVTVFVEDMYKLLKSCNKNDTLFLEVTDDYMSCKIESSNGNSRIFEFVLPSDDITSRSLPSIDVPVSFRCVVNDLKQSVKDISLINSDLFKMSIIDGEFNISTSKEIPTNYTNSIRISIDRYGRAVSNYDVNYISQILKFEKISKEVELKLGDNMPLVYEFKDDLMGVKIGGMIAPRLEQED